MPMMGLVFNAPDNDRQEGTTQKQNGPGPAKPQTVHG
jgi:hypothetical protein